MASIDDVYNLLTEVKVTQAEHCVELEALNQTSVETNKILRAVEVDVAILKDVRERSASTDETKVLKAIEKSDDRKGNKAIWLAVIAAISAFAMQMVGCFQSFIESTP